MGGVGGDAGDQRARLGAGPPSAWAWPRRRGVACGRGLELAARSPPGSSSLGFTSSPSPFSSSSPENVEDSGLDSPSHAAPGPSPDSWAPCPGTPQSPAGCRAPPPESRGTRPVQPSDSPQPLAPSPGPWGLEAVAGGGESSARVIRALGGGLRACCDQRPNWGTQQGLRWQKPRPSKGQ